MAEHYPILLVLVPLLTAALIPLLARANRSIPWLATMLSCALAFFISIKLLLRVLAEGRISYWLGNWPPPWGIEYAVDHLNGFVLVVVSFIALMVSIYSRRSIEKEILKHRHTAFYTLFMLLVAGLLGILITGDIFNLYVFIEISSLSGYALIASGTREKALTATFNYLILGTVGATFLLLGVGMLYMVTGTLNMADLGERLPGLYESRVVLTAFAFFSVGLSLKMALFPLHIWMPNAYTHAPSAVSSILAATSTKVGAYALIRIMFTVFDVEFASTVPYASIFIVLATAGILAGSIIAIAQTNLKMMLAYSSVGQIGYIVLGVALINETALTGSIMHILNHALMKGALFLVAGAVVYRTGVEDISGLRGLGRKMPLTMAAFTVAALSMIGVPLTVGFVSKWYLAIGAIEAGMWFIVPVILISSVLTAVYFWRIIESIYFDKGPGATSGPSIQEAPAGMLVPTLIMSALCVVFGIAAYYPAYIARLAASALLGGGAL